jgi:transposase
MRRTRMEKAKEILRLSLMKGLSIRDVANATGCSLGTVSAVLSRVKESGVSDPLNLGPKELGEIIYPAARDKSRAEPDCAHIDRELKKKGVTLTILWEEYKIQNPNGYMYTQFCDKYRKYRKENSVYMRRIFKAGEKMMVDWAGLTMQYLEDGREKAAYVFVAILPASSYMYAHPFPDMKMENWIEGHVNAFEYFGGVPYLLVPDNTKTAVNKANRYEAELNRTYQEMAKHYGTAVVPARPYSPTDKAPVETAVQIIERRIIAKLRHTRFMSIGELQDAVYELVEELNKQPFQKLQGSRLSAFLETERNELMRLPETRYEYAQFKQARAGFDYHIALDKTHYYSVPYQFAGKTVQIRSTSRTVEVFCDGERIACHVRSMNANRRYITDPSHMPESHRAVADWSPERFLSWAEKTGPKTREYIGFLLGRKDHPEQSYRTCAGILRLGSKAMPVKMEETCALALAHNIYSYTYFCKLLEDRKKQEPVMHENLRGKEYYKGDDHA